MNFTK